jgi:hypothetical protein
VKRRGFLAVLAGLVAAPWMPGPKPVYTCRTPSGPMILRKNMRITIRDWDDQEDTLFLAT